MSQPRHHIIPPQSGLILYFDGKNHGPFTLDQVKKMYEGKEIQIGTYLWYPGLDNWVTIGDIPEYDRRSNEAPTNMPKKTSLDQVIATIRNVAVAISFEGLQALVKTGDFRRSDLIFDDSTQEWLRGDQHPKMRAYFHSPKMVQKAG